MTEQPNEMTRAVAKLTELQLRPNTENIRAYQTMKRTPQFPHGYDEITSRLNNYAVLPEAMKRLGISSIAHAEGPTVWDHVEQVVTQVNHFEGIDAPTRDALRLLAFYHDLGKTSPFSYNSVRSRDLTSKRLGQGRLQMAMIGHEREMGTAIRNGLAANGIVDEELELFMRIIQNHMHADIGDPAATPQRVAKVIESLGTTEDERQRATTLFALLLKADGNATKHITLTPNGQLITEVNAKKADFDPEKLWQKYLAAKNT